MDPATSLYMGWLPVSPIVPPSGIRKRLAQKAGTNDTDVAPFEYVRHGFVLAAEH